MTQKSLVHDGHLIDSGILTNILNLIIDEGGDYEISRFDIGKTPADESHLHILLKAPDSESLEALAGKLSVLGMRVFGEIDAVWEKVTRDKAAPENFYSTTNHRTEVYYEGKWRPAARQRMDAAIVKRHSGPECVKLRDLKAGDDVLIGSASVTVHPPVAETGGTEGFSFMDNDVSSERNATLAAEKVASEMRDIRQRGGKIVAVAGPVVVHTGGGDALAKLVSGGWIQGFLGGNAIAVHDLESQLFGTSLGVDLTTGRPTHKGHKNHMMAINEVYSHGSIAQMIASGELEGGLMHAVIDSSIPYCLAGSIRDDGPLPETETDMIAAQKAYAEIITDAEMILMLSTMLHSIGTGNMTPSWVKTVCVDINPAVVTKLSDRGSAQAVGIVSDVGLFLRALASSLDG